MERIGIASDHAGYQLKEYLVGWLASKGYEVYDLGCNSEESCDYPDFAHALAGAIEDGTVESGVAICGTANGISMALNKHQSVRAAVCWKPEIADMARRHNNANVCSLPARHLENGEAEEILKVFLSVEFEGGRHQRRIDKIPVIPEQK